MSSTPQIVDHDTWLQARLEHLADEKAFTKQRDALSRKRRDLPWLEITDDYRFEGPSGEVTLRDSFGDADQLIVYHFMLGPGWVEGCPSCSFWADNYDGIGVHLAARNTALVTISRAPLAEITAYRERMGWQFPWYSSANSSFNFDMNVSATPAALEDGTATYNHGTQAPFGEESAGISVFSRTDDGIFLTYQTFARGLDMLNGAYHLLDLTANGRDEDDLPFSMAWLRRHDSYETDQPSA